MIGIDAVPGLQASGLNLEIEQSQTLAVTWAIRELLRTLESGELLQADDGSWSRVARRIIPQTVLLTDAHVGDTTVTIDPTALDGVAAFERSGLLSLFDLSDEEHLPIASTWDEASGVIPLDFTGMDYSGLRFEHAAGAGVGSGLYTETPETLDHMLDFTNPVIFMTVMRQRRYAYGTSQVMPTYIVRIEYRLAETQPRSFGADNAMMNPNTFGFRIQRRAMRVMDVIADALQHDWTLRTPLGEVAIAQQDPRNPDGEIWDEELNSVLVKQSTLQFSASATLPVAAQLKFIDQF